MFEPFSALKGLNLFATKKGKIGPALEYDIEVLETERVSRKYSAPDKPTEAGYEITDNTTARPIQFSITVIDNSWNYSDNRRILETFADKKTPIKYYSPIDRKIYENVIIESLDFNAQVSQSSGFTAAMQFKKINTVVAKDATYSIEKDSSGTTAQSTNTDISSAALKTDTAEGKFWSSDGLFYKYMGKGGGT